MFDTNYKKVSFASNETKAVPLKASVDGRLLIEVVEGVEYKSDKEISADENYKYVSLASNGTKTVPLATNSDGHLLIDLTFE